MLQKYVHPVFSYSKTDRDNIAFHSGKALKPVSVKVVTLHNVKAVTPASDKAIKHHSGKAVTYYNINAPPW